VSADIVPLLIAPLMSADFSSQRQCVRLKKKVKIKKHLPIDIAEELSVLRVSHIRVDF
jgi:hypothetical protein